MTTIVMTGGTSGLGQIAAQRMAGVPGTRVLVGARGSASGAIETLPLDLTRLTSVREFAGALAKSLGDTPIDALVLNAGVQFPNIDQRTEDGFEAMFGVNHLAHYLLLRLLLGKVADGATVVITTSDTHDPKMVPMGPKALDPELSAHPKPQEKPTGFTDGFKAYASSKLCNLLTARALACSRDAAGKSLTVIAYNPSLTAGTSLYRAAPFWMRSGVAIAGALRAITRMNTVEIAGSTLADLALARAKPQDGRVYASLVKRKLTWPDPSELARDDEVMRGLWRESARMVGLPA
jgi:NAD(P)-dependent dehydrogenase (short-subunit alcohol dehydrogenase family)